MQKKTKSLSAFIFFILSPLVFLLFFQNCGQKLQSEMVLSSLTLQSNLPPPTTEDPNTPTTEVPVAEVFPLKFGEPEVNAVFRGDLIQLKISKRDSKFPDEFKLTAASTVGEAIATIDFLPFEKELRIGANGFVEVSIETKIPAPFGPEKKINLRIDYKIDGIENSFTKVIVLKSRYEPIKFREVRSGYASLCGLGFDDGFYCWGLGSGSKEVFKADTQPVKINLPNNQKVDFSTIQIGDTLSCFKSKSSQALYCYSGVSSTPYIAQNEINLTNAFLVHENVLSFGVAGTVIYFITADNKLYHKYINQIATPSFSATNPDANYQRIFPGYLNAIGVKTDGQFVSLVWNGINPVTVTPLPNFSANVIITDVIGSDNSRLVMRDRRIVPLPYYSDSYSSLVSFPNNFSRLVSPGSGSTFCYIASDQKVYCQEGNQFVLKQDLQASAFSSVHRTGNSGLCFLKANGEYYCLGSAGNGITNSTLFPEYREITVGDVAAYEAAVIAAGKTFITDNVYGRCTWDTFGILECDRVKIFGHNRIKFSTLKTYKISDSTAGAIVAETLSGRLLATKMGPAMDQTSLLQIFKIAQGQEHRLPGPLFAGCPEGFTEVGQRCQPITPLTISVANANRIISYPNTEEQIEFTVTMSRPLSSDIILNLTPNKPDCSATSPFNISSACFAELASLCQANCQTSEFTVETANSHVGSTFNRFDWNYKFASPYFVVPAGQTTSRFYLKISKDLRNERNRVLQLKLSPSIFSGITFENDVNILFRKSLNPIADPSSMTYANLMDRRFGILGLNCVKCHNSVDMGGGYDMTDYDMMVSRGVINLQNLSQSKMFIRMDPQLGNLAKPMPLDGFLINEKVLEVKKWILNGAKNN